MRISPGWKWWVIKREGPPSRGGPGRGSSSSLRGDHEGRFISSGRSQGYKPHEMMHGGDR